MDVLGVFVVVASAPLDILVLKVDLTGDLTPLGTPTAKLQGAALTCHLSPAACQCPVKGKSCGITFYPFACIACLQPASLRTQPGQQPS